MINVLLQHSNELVVGTPQYIEVERGVYTAQLSSTYIHVGYSLPLVLCAKYNKYNLQVYLKKGIHILKHLFIIHV